MQKLLKYMSAAMAITTGISILACGGGTTPQGGETCTFDDECSPGYICDRNLNECVEGCIDDNDCYEGEFCLPRQGADGYSCQIPSNNTTNNTTANNITTGECTPDTQLQDCGEEGFCNELGECEYPMTSMTYRAVYIEDTSTGEAACNNSDPGSDIIDVYLLNSGGEAVGYATLINWFEGDQPSGNDYSFAGNFDGAPSGVNVGQECTDTLGESDALALGCLGGLLVQFVDSSMQPIDLQQGDRVAVFEYGSNCPTGSDTDSYEVYLCTDNADAVDNASSTSCTSFLGGGEGYVDVSVSLP